jgi:protein transport protein SEC31
MQRVAAKAPATFAPQVKDTQKRLNLLFDHLNNEELVQPSTIEQLLELSQAIQSKEYNLAQKLQVDIQRDKTDECGNWMVRFRLDKTLYRIKLTNMAFLN